MVLSSSLERVMTEFPWKCPIFMQEIQEISGMCVERNLLTVENIFPPPFRFFIALVMFMCLRLETFPLHGQFGLAPSDYMNRIQRL
jgi:hypothetical protein